jgi:hypothetical protein
LSANSIEPGQTARMCRLAWLYTGGKDLMLSGPAFKGLKNGKFVILIYYQDSYFGNYIIFHRNQTHIHLNLHNFLIYKHYSNFLK